LRDVGDERVERERGDARGPPIGTRVTDGDVPRKSTAASGTMRPVLVALDILPVANSPPTNARPAFGIETYMRTWRVVGSAVGFTRTMCPTNSRPGYPLTVNTTGTPTRISDSCSAGTEASSLMLDGSTTVNSAVPG